MVLVDIWKEKGGTTRWCCESILIGEVKLAAHAYASDP
jgi:hypothetical protein